MISESGTVLASETRMMESSHSGRKYRITISLPLGYGKSSDEGWPFNTTPAQWPVVYVLDGNWYAFMVAGIIRPMAWCGSTTDAIVVGIGYAEDADPNEAFWESMTRRNLDLTPVRDEAEEKSMGENHGRLAPTGDSAGFLKFFKDELVPAIEKDYRADPSRRILVGHSYGSLFGLFAMLEAPGLFETLILGSPTMSYKDCVMFQREEAFAKDHTKLPAKVYLFAGELEESLKDRTLTDTLRLAAILQGRKYEGLSLVKHVFLDQNHCEVAAPGFQWGLKHALKK
jgi:predicted alpha/beta superfamily hydrolase